MVPPGLRLTVASVTNRPVEADRFTDRPLPVPDPTLSVVVFPGHLATVAFATNRPLPALRWMLRAMIGPFPNTFPESEHLPGPLGEDLSRQVTSHLR